MSKAVDIITFSKTQSEIASFKRRMKMNLTSTSLPIVIVLQLINSNPIIRGITR